MILTSKQRAYLKSLAMTQDAILYLGNRELIKIGVQNNCADDPRELAEMIAERTHSTVVQVIGKKIVLYKPGTDKNRKIELPRK